MSDSTIATRLSNEVHKSGTDTTRDTGRYSMGTDQRKNVDVGQGYKRLTSATDGALGKKRGEHGDSKADEEYDGEGGVLK